MNLKVFLRLGIFVFIFYFLTLIFSHFLNIGIEEVQIFVSSFGILAPLIYSLILFLGLVVPFNPISDFIVINMGVILFSPLVAIFFTFIAHSLAISLNYFIGLRYGKRFINIIVKKENAPYLDKYFKKLTIRNLFIIRFFIPISSFFGFDVISYISGIQKLPFDKYFVVSIVPWTFMSILYFSTTSYFLKKSIFLYFLPVIFLVGVPFIIYFIYRISEKKK